MVTDGRVAVESGGRELFLGPGSRWSSTPEAAPVASTAPASAPDEGAPPTVSRSGVPSSAGRRSTLRDENELFRAAMDAEREDKLDQVVTLTDRLLRTHPDSPLAADARTLQLEARRKRAASTPP
ncbi:MAG TPA: hypothetical protein VHC69_34280 [Polyangiaceae bacterium]|nr:hypothetical protein [Polyangiaceae bacterium]